MRGLQAHLDLTFVRPFASTSLTPSSVLRTSSPRWGEEGMAPVHSLGGHRFHIGKRRIDETPPDDIVAVDIGIGPHPSMHDPLA